MRHAAPALALAIAASASTAAAQMTFVGQSRSIQLSARADDPPGAPVVNPLTVTAPDFGPFLSNPAVSATGASGFSSVSGSQNSTLAGDRITASGNSSASANFQGSDPGFGVQSSGSSLLEVEFSLTQTVAYSLTGSLFCTSLSANPSVRLRSSSGTILFILQPANLGTTPVQRTGFLAPGSYIFGVSAHSAAFESASFWIGYGSSFTTELVVEPVVVPYCFGDGSGTACPCSPAPVPHGAAGMGCPNNLFASGAGLAASGFPSLSADTLVLTATDLINGACLVFQGTAAAGAGLGTAFGDGLRCATGTQVRFATRAASAHTYVYPDTTLGDASISVRGGVAAPGPRYYQAWYRSANPSFCPAPQGGLFNLTNGLQVSWKP